MESRLVARAVSDVFVISRSSVSLKIANSTVRLQTVGGLGNLPVTIG
jgi:hypothetical protein